MKAYIIDKNTVQIGRKIYKPSTNQMIGVQGVKPDDYIREVEVNNSSIEEAKEVLDGLFL